MSDIRKKLEGFCTKNQISLIQQGGILHKQLLETQKLLTEDFEVFSQSRFSVRDFGDTPISMVQIKKALKMCERTPTACNRQSVRIHIFSKSDDKNKMFRLQMGCKGFENDMQCAILICGDMANYQFYEYSTLFTDGGIYAMNLLYALHREGLAAIPLTMGSKFGNLKRVKKGMNLPDNEIPILLIGVGSYKAEYKVAESHRFDYSTYCSFH